jgi:hypothetical protein
VIVVGPGIVQVTVGTGQPMVVVLNVTLAVHTPGPVLVTIFDGQLMVGATIISVTVGCAPIMPALPSVIMLIGPSAVTVP